MMPAMFFLYELLAILAFVLVLPFYALARTLGGRRLGNLRRRIGFNVGENGAHDVWIHSVSVGEVAAGRILADAILRLRPETTLLVTTTTVTGQQLAERLFPEATVTWFPFDFTLSVKRFLRTFSPSLHIAMETELWPILTRTASRSGVKMVVANGRLSDRSFPRYLRFRFLAARVLRWFDLILVREQIDRERFVGIGAPPDRVVITGNVKFDLELPSEELPFAPQLRRLAAARPIVMLGSTAEGEETLLLGMIRSLVEEAIFVVVAPRKQARFDSVHLLLSETGLDVARRTEVTPVSAADVLLLDSIGELARLYRDCSAAFIGGSLVDHGGQNPVEAAASGCPVAFGPHMTNFRDIASELVECEGAVLVESAEGLGAFFTDMVRNPESRARRAAKGRDCVERNRGAAERTARRLLELLH